MSYFIFVKNQDNIEGTIYKIAQNQNELDNLNIVKSDYKIIEDSESNFNLVKFGNKFPLKYDNNVITYVDIDSFFKNKTILSEHLENIKYLIKNFVINNPSHSLFNRWNDYLTQLNSLNLDNINYPLIIPIEQYLNDLGQPSFNILQIP